MKVLFTDNKMCKDFELFQNVFKELKEYLEDKEFNVRKFDIKHLKTYNEIKSYRSSVTEGNTTTIGDFTKLILSDDKSEKYAPTYDEQNEIVNLIKVYSKDYSFNKKNLGEINYILGDDILKNNFIYYRGKFRKKGICYIQYKHKDEDYCIQFTENEKVILMLDKLFENFKKIKCNSKVDNFILALITHNELLSIHPFSDGNGRSIRTLIEKNLESKNIFPFIPFSNNKRDYQEAMGQFHIDKQTDYINAYKKFVDYIIRDYDFSCNEIIEAVEKLENKKNNVIMYL